MERTADPGDRGPTENKEQLPAELALESASGMEQLWQEERESHAKLPTGFRMLDSVVRTVMVAVIAVLVVAVSANVFSRFVLNHSLPASAELSRFLFIWAIFLGAALAHLHNEHIAVSLLVDRLSPALRRWVVVLQELIILGITVALLLSAVKVMAISPGASPLLGVPLSVVNFSVPFSAVLMALITCHRIWVALRSPQTEEVAR